jgi:GNAT superfamily N-acetyltransferase
VTGEPHPLGNLAIVSEPGKLEITQAAIGPLLACGFPMAVLYPQGVAAHVARSMVALGFEAHGAMPAMAVDIGRMTATAAPPGYDCSRIGAGNDGRAWAETLATGYGLPLGLALRFSPESLGADMAPDARTQFFAIRRNGRPVATSLLYLADGLAGIYCVATLPEERGKGLGAHVTAEALRTAHRQGYRVGVLQSSPDGHSVYLGLGFEDFGSVPMFVRMPD